VLKTLVLTDKQKREFVDALDGDIYRKLPKARMALMLRLEALVSDGSKKQAFNHLSLEHVLPQTPPSDWIEWFQDEDERDAWTHLWTSLKTIGISQSPTAWPLVRQQAEEWRQALYRVRHLAIDA